MAKSKDAYDEQTLAEVVREADTFTQALIEFLQPFVEDEDEYAIALLKQAEALGDNARKALKGTGNG